MTSLLTITPPDAEPLPLYSRRDPDSVSLLSTAPSYVSETPTYTPSLPSMLPPLQPDQEVGRGLPAPRYAPGFQNRGANGSLADMMARNCTFAMTAPRWANNARQHDAVARRRANTRQAETTAMLNSLAAVPPPQSCSSSTAAATTSPYASSSALPLRSTSPQNHRRPTTARSSTHHNPSSTSTSSLLLPLEPSSPTSPSHSQSHSQSPSQHSPFPTHDAYPVRVGSSADPLHPLEDPYLVGEAAADRARAARVYREMCLREAEATGYESRSWDFMMGQMSDWEERSRSWKGFRKSVGNSKGVLGRRLAFGKAW